MEAFPVIFTIGIIAFVIGMIVWGVNHQKKVRENWMKFAQKYGLQMAGGTSFASRPSIQGWFDGVHIQLNTVVRGSGKNRSTYTQHHATVNAPMPAGLVLTKEGFFSKVGKMFGGQDVQIGDRTIDEAFIIKAHDLMGAHDLLSNAHVKKALLYCITRHPGMKIENRHILVETNGMTGSLEKLESVFNDLSYLVKTCDAAYQEIAAARGIEAPQTVQTPQQVRREAARDKREADQVRRDAAQADILDMSYRGGDRQPEVREVSVEDTAAKQAAMAQMAAAMNAFGDKLETGELEQVDTSAAEAISSGTGSDAFADPNVGDAFADPHLLQGEDDESAAEHEVEAEHAMHDYDPRKSFEEALTSGRDKDSGGGVFDSDDASDAFENPELFQEEEEKPGAPEPAGEKLGSFDAIVKELSNSSLMSSDREKIIERHGDTAWELEIVVDRVDSSFGFDLPDELRDGKTIEGHFKDGPKVAVRFPKSKTDEVKNLRSGETLKVWGKLTKWDDLFKKATLDAE